MNTLEAQVRGKEVVIKDYQFEERLIHEDCGRVNELISVVENNRRLIRMETIFRKRFEDLDEKIGEKKEEVNGMMMVREWMS